jgi:hypothetical protein
LEVAAFAAVAIPAERLEIIQLIAAAVADRNDVVEFKWFIGAAADLAFVFVAPKYLEAAVDGNPGAAP